jgi:hypothetical protein
MPEGTIQIQNKKASTSLSNMDGQWKDNKT